METINSGSIIESTGKVSVLPKPIFSFASSLVITLHGSASVPVPAVVGIAITGNALVTGRPLPLPAGDVIPVISVVAGHDGNGFRRVNAASSAKSNDEIAFLFTTDRCSFHYVRFNRVGQNLVIDNRFRIVFLQQFNDFVEVAVFSSWRFLTR